MGQGRGGVFVDLEKYAEQLRQSEKAGALDALAHDPAGERLLAGLDRAAMERAAKAGDMKALGQLLQGVLATAEGRRFAEKVQKAVQNGGR